MRHLHTGQSIIAESELWEAYCSVKKDLKELLCHGAANTPENMQYFNAYSDFINGRIDTIPKSLLSSQLKSGIAGNKLANSELFSQSPRLANFVYGSATCEGFSYFTAYVLAQTYDFSCRIESIYSYEVHSYLVMESEHLGDYVLDTWSDCFLPYDDDSQWNEAVPYEYSRRGEYQCIVDKRFKSHELRELFSSFLTAEIKAQRASVIKEVDEAYLHVLATHHSGLFAAAKAPLSSKENIPPSATLDFL